MSDYTLQTHIAETLTTVDNLLNCLSSDEKLEPKNLLLKGAIEHYKNEDMEIFGLVMLELFSQTANDAMKKIQDEIMGDK